MDTQEAQTIQGGPYLVIPSRKGSVPSLTPTQSGQILEEDERILGLSVFDAMDDYVDACAKLNVSFARFCGLPDYKVVLTLRSSFLGHHQSAPSTEAGISGDHERGRSAVSVAKWKEILAAVKPAVAVELSESIPLSEPPTRKRRTSTIRTMTWAKKTKEEVEKDDNVSGCRMYLEPMLASNGSSGFLDAFSRNENVREFAAGLDSLHLSLSTPSFVCAYSVSTILAAISAGVQLIESPLPWELAEKGVALSFSVEGQKGQAPNTEAEMDLNDDVYTLDIAPLCPGCECYTCKRHNRAYIHHLLTVQEMNSNILLSIHNLHMVVQLFRQARKLGDDRGALRKYIDDVLSQF